MKIPIYTDFQTSTMPRNHVSSDRSAKYHPMKLVGSDGYVDDQFAKPPPQVPYRAIFLAAVLFIIGAILIILGSLLMAGIFDKQYADRTWPLLILGILMFIPGAYHVRIAWYAHKGYDGFSYDDIPEFD